jgi:hypothetical protein
MRQILWNLIFSGRHNRRIFPDNRTIFSLIASFNPIPANVFSNERHRSALVRRAGTLRSADPAHGSVRRYRLQRRNGTIVKKIPLI